MRWNRWSAVLGGIAWTALAVLAPFDLIALLFLLAPLVVAPLVLELSGLPRFLSLAQPFAAALAAASFLVPRGPAAGLVAAPWAGLMGLVALAAFFRLRRAFAAGMPDLLETLGLLPVVVGGGMLVAARGGIDVGGFPPVIILLTAVHFHFTMFAAPLLAARAARTRPLLLAAGALLLVATPFLAIGFIFSPRLQVAAAFAVSLAVTAIGLGQLGTVRGRVARALLLASSGAVVAGMVLAGIYALGEFLRTGWLSLPEMARTHGILNAFGFVLCGLLARTPGTAKEAASLKSGQFRPPTEAAGDARKAATLKSWQFYGMS